MTTTDDGIPTITRTLTRTTDEDRGTRTNETINELTKRPSVRYTTTRYRRQDEDTRNDNEKRKTNATSAE